MRYLLLAALLLGLGACACKPAVVVEPAPVVLPAPQYEPTPTPVPSYEHHKKPKKE